MHKLYQIQQLTLKCVSFSARLASGLSVWTLHVLVFGGWMNNYATTM